MEEPPQMTIWEIIPNDPANPNNAVGNEEPAKNPITETISSLRNEDMSVTPENDQTRRDINNSTVNTIIYGEKTNDSNLENEDKGEEKNTKKTIKDADAHTVDLLWNIAKKYGVPITYWSLAKRGEKIPNSGIDPYTIKRFLRKYFVVHEKKGGKNLYLPNTEEWRLPWENDDTPQSIENSGHTGYYSFSHALDEADKRRELESEEQHNPYDVDNKSEYSEEG